MKRAYKPSNFSPEPIIEPAAAPAPVPAPAPAPVPAPAPQAPPVAQAPVIPDVAKMFQLFMQQQAMNNFLAMTSASAPGMPNFMSSFMPSISQSVSQIPPLPPAPPRLPLLPMPPAPVAVSAMHVSDAARRVIIHGIRSATDAVPVPATVPVPVSTPVPAPVSATVSAPIPAANTKAGEVSPASGNWYFDGRDMRGSRVNVVRRNQEPPRISRDRSRSRERSSSRYGRY